LGLEILVGQQVVGAIFLPKGWGSKIQMYSVASKLISTVPAEYINATIPAKQLIDLHITSLKSSNQNAPIFEAGNLPSSKQFFALPMNVTLRKFRS